jgi:hypothetical protein
VPLPDLKSRWGRAGALPAAACRGCSQSKQGSARSTACLTPACLLPTTRHLQVPPSHPALTGLPPGLAPCPAGLRHGSRTSAASACASTDGAGKQSSGLEWGRLERCISWAESRMRHWRQAEGSARAADAALLPGADPSQR